ncbi:MAG: hypothetical protein CL424_17110 [Acidimicrobiaceae bacterium]|nr:hypothetical protein [Acidimicrobiaceae bacterium]
MVEVRSVGGRVRSRSRSQRDRGVCRQLRSAWHDDAMTLVIAHRGASVAEPENTIAAFERAVAMGVDMIELDV